MLYNAADSVLDYPQSWRRREIMIKLTAVATTFLAAAATLSGCQPRYNYLPEYERSSPTTIYKYTSYPGSSSSVSEDGWLEVAPSIRYTAPAPVIKFWWNRPYSNGYANNYGTSYYGGGYSGPAFTTPPMQPMPYPTEWYYPFKRPSPGVFVPWNRSYYPITPSYYPSPPQQMRIPQIYPRLRWYYP
jgi:hypothetical protein